MSGAAPIGQRVTVPAPPPSSTPEMQVFEAVLALLRADAAVLAAVGGSAERVLDEVPTDTVKPPYVYAGPIGRQREPDTYVEAYRVRMRIYSASTGFGRRQAWAITGAVSDALHGRMLTLVGPFSAVEEIIVTQGGDVAGPPSPKTAFIDIDVLVQRG